MDVRAWLQNTADREPPDEEDKAGYPEYLRPERYTAEEHTHLKQSKRKRASSEPHHAQRHPSRGRYGGHGQAAECHSSSDHVRGTRGTHTGTASSRSSSSDERRESSPDRRFNRTFERRARHKTKEHRYEPKSKKRKKEHESRKERKAKEKEKSKRRKPHRSGDGARTAGLITSFQLKDRPKNNRLTLRPADVSAGIFKHGRAGAPIVGNGSGLPDLVFNEMRFLRRPREHQDETAPNQYEKDQVYRADKQQGGDISTYFAKPPREAPRSQGQHQSFLALDQNIELCSQGMRQTAGSLPRQEARSTEANGNHQTSSFLGFGRRGPNQEANTTNRRSNSCYTWSESVPAPRSPVQQVPTQVPKTMAYYATNPDTEISARPRSGRRPHELSDYLLARPAPDTSAGRWVNSQRSRRFALDEAHKPVAPAQPLHRRNHLATRHPASISLPCSALDLPMPPGRTVSSGGTADRCPTSDILRIGAIGGNEERPPSRHSSLLFDQSDDKENQEPSTSTPTSKLLRRAFHTITGPQCKVPSNAHEPQLDDCEEHQRKPHLAQSSDDTVQLRKRMLAEPKQGLFQPPEQQTFSMPERGFSRWTDASRAEQQQSVARPATRAFGFMAPAPVLPRAYHEAARSFGPGLDNEMLDNFAHYQPTPLAHQHTFTHSRQADDLVRRLISNRQDDSFAPQKIAAEYWPTRSDRQGDFSAHTADLDGRTHLPTDSETAVPSTAQPYSQMRSNDDTPHSAPDSGGGQMQRDSMPGFWRPNKLY